MYVGYVRVCAYVCARVRLHMETEVQQSTNVVGFSRIKSIWIFVNPYNTFFCEFSRSPDSNTGTLLLIAVDINFPLVRLSRKDMTSSKFSSIVRREYSPEAFSRFVTFSKMV